VADKISNLSENVYICRSGSVRARLCRACLFSSRASLQRLRLRRRRMRLRHARWAWQGVGSASLATQP